ncbi:MAG: ceramidase domain-containing protein [Candidatus Euphemobacter frigidus]|nr:ceramidase domain-containing protein [Candidatus Euphemobacter frigidus]MDP8275218.1 ceramidase domain-containing protein [Candidatus Euphemobacter frigidus]
MNKSMISAFLLWRGSPSSRPIRVLIVIAPGVIGLLVLLCLSPILLNPAYHAFADSRTYLGIPHFANVVTNLAFIFVGLHGFSFMICHPGPGSIFREQRERFAYYILFIGLVLTGLGSAWYHLDPATGRLLWDRLPMILAFMPIFSIVITERISLRVGTVLLFPLIILGLASVIYWRLGGGDQRFYGLVQFYPMLAIPLVLLLFSPRYTRARYFWGVVGLYGIAKLCELFDGLIYDLGGIISGHSLKHFFAALGVWWIVLMLRGRRPLLIDEQEPAREDRGVPSKS